MTEEDSLQGREQKTHWWLFILAAVIVIGVVIVYRWLLLEYFSVIVPMDQQKALGPGTFGDAFGVVNTLFSGLAFAALVFTIYQQNRQLKTQSEELALQRHELALQRDELEETRKELKRSADAQERSEKAMAEQAEFSALNARLQAANQMYFHKENDLKSVGEKLVSGVISSESDLLTKQRSIISEMEVLLLDIEYVYTALKTYPVYCYEAVDK